MPRWLTYTLLTMLLWGGWGFVSKPLADKLSPWQMQALSALGLAPVIAFLVFSKNLRSGASARRGFWLAFASGLIAGLGNVAYYQALAAGGKAADVTPLTALYPVVTIVLAILLLGERLNKVQGLGIAFSLTAMYFFNVGADSGWVNQWLLVALIPIGLWGVAALLQKCAANHASSELATTAFLLGGLPMSLFSPLFVSMTWKLPPATYGLALAVGLLFGLGNLTLIFAYSLGGKASVVTPMAGLYSLVTIPLAVVILGEKVSGREGVAIALALGAAIALSRETTAQHSGSSPASTT
jgi:uncharacterized membrane protein